jgi:hypothetical protein
VTAVPFLCDCDTYDLRIATANNDCLTVPLHAFCNDIVLFFHGDYVVRLKGLLGRSLHASARVCREVSNGNVGDASYVLVEVLMCVSEVHVLPESLYDRHTASATSTRVLVLQEYGTSSANVDLPVPTLVLQLRAYRSDILQT